MKKIGDKNLITGFVIGLIICLVVGVSANNLYQANSITYKESNVEEALNQLYDIETNKITELEERMTQIENQSTERYNGTDFFHYSIDANTASINQNVSKRLFDITAGTLTNTATFLEYNKNNGLKIKESGFYIITMRVSGTNSLIYGIININNTIQHQVAAKLGNENGFSSITIYLNKDDIIDPIFKVYNNNITLSWSAMTVRKLT